MVDLEQSPDYVADKSEKNVSSRAVLDSVTLALLPWCVVSKWQIMTIHNESPLYVLTELGLLFHAQPDLEF